jgi:hypothetical protein|tara:strand:- start:1852 stop:2061 length:210 start_codon:yes stop_codon:yes gene_type:complete
MKTEANIISFRVLINSKGTLMTEYSKLPSSKVLDVFSEDEAVFIRKILRELEPKLEDLHTFLEEELQAF